jgi:class 3 adenylate cyclase
LRWQVGEASGGVPAAPPNDVSAETTYASLKISSWRLHGDMTDIADQRCHDTDVDDSSRGVLTAAGLPCGSCGTELPSESKFCHECGAPLTQVSRSAEYKQVTVLFADVVRSMDIAATLDIERLREIMTDVVERSAAVAQRYGGTVEYTGDGVMAIFGAPAALEDHAFRACVASLAIQDEMKQLATEVKLRDEVALQVRVGLNSGRVIAGEIGSGSLGYRATGEQVGFAQRMESVAPAGGVMLSESTAQLVEDSVVLSEPEWVRIKGSDDPVPARRLLAIGPRRALIGRPEASLVGRRGEMAALEAFVDRTIGGNGGVVNVVGPPGIGKSRVAREAGALAAVRGADVHWIFCESHARDVPFRVVAGLLRAALGVADLDGEAARGRVRVQVPNADPQDLLLLDDLLSIADPDVALPAIDPDARRRRLTALVNTASLARVSPTVYVIEDAHWIDEVSESMLADFFTVIPQTPSLVLITYRPEYRGALSQVQGAPTIALAPLSDPETGALVTELVGPDPSVAVLAKLIVERAAGNPFFAHEIARDLAERGVLQGPPGGYSSTNEATEVSLPATVQATIAARIDRLDPKAKYALTAAAVVGSRFRLDLLTALGVEPVVADLVAAQLIDQVGSSTQAEYVFLHPLIHTVAYESQLKSARTRMHRCLAEAIESGDPASADENAALIAEHLVAAGDLHAASTWHMRAGAWLIHRDVTAARASWQRARLVADLLVDVDPQRAAMRIAPRTMLCATAFIAGGSMADTGYD